MKLIGALLSICCWTLAETQTTTQTNRHKRQVHNVNRDQISFYDDGQRNGINFPSATGIRSQTEQQHTIENQNNQQDILAEQQEVVIARSIEPNREQLYLGKNRPQSSTILPYVTQTELQNDVSNSNQSQHIQGNYYLSQTNNPITGMNSDKIYFNNGPGNGINFPLSQPTQNNYLQGLRNGAQNVQQSNTANFNQWRQHQQGQRISIQDGQQNNIANHNSNPYNQNIYLQEEQEIGTQSIQPSNSVVLNQRQENQNSFLQSQRITQNGQNTNVANPNNRPHNQNSYLEVQGIGAQAGQQGNFANEDRYFEGQGNVQTGPQNGIASLNRRPQNQDSYSQAQNIGTPIGQQMLNANQRRPSQESYLQGQGITSPINKQQTSQVLQNNKNGLHIKQLSSEFNTPPLDRNNGLDPFIVYNHQNAANGGNKDTNVHTVNMSLAMTNFGLNLIQNIDLEGRNVVASPYSVSILLALLQQGAAGETRKQLTALLQVDPYNSAEFFAKNTNDIQKRISRNTLRIANNLYVNDAFELNPDFRRVANQSFGSDVTPIKFVNSDAAVREINQWVATRTNNQIRQLLASGAVGGNTQLMLVNAVYFKGMWQAKFKPESTLQQEFHLRNGQTKIVPYMRMRRVFRTGFDPTNNVQVINLPFESNQFSLMVILPDIRSSLEEVVSTLTGEQLAAYHSFTPKEVELAIPKFTARSDTDLNQVLRKMGVTSMFGPQSELTAIGKLQRFPPQVSSAVHSAVLSIDEKGGTAAAATAIAVVALSYDDPAVIFKSDRPFLAVLWDNDFSTPLFMARIEDPAA